MTTTADGDDAVAVVEPLGHLADLGEGHGVEAPVSPELKLAELESCDGRIVAGVGLGVGIAFDLPPGITGDEIVLVAVHDTLVADLGESLKEFLRFRSSLRISAFEGLRRHCQRSPQCEDS